MIDGVLVIDKPEGLTSHDVVAAARRALAERRIGHTGTLDPIATGVLPLACGRATRLVRFLTASDKEYDVTIRLGLATDTYDVTGREVSRSQRRPDREQIAAALTTFCGEYSQAPPPYSAKKIQGQRSYELARSNVAVQPPPSRVRVDRLELVGVHDDAVEVRVSCSAGFYVRSLAHELGVRLGTGACVAALRRTRSGEFDLAGAIPMDELARDGALATSRVVCMAGLLPGYPAAVLTEEGLDWVAHGRTIGPRHLDRPLTRGGDWVRLLSPDGALVALGRWTDAYGALHPSVVLI